MALRTRRARSGADTWAGFVDALSALLMVLIFALVVFMIAQLFQGVALTGQDRALGRLQDRVQELNDMLALERSDNAGIREDLEQLSLELQQSAAARDETLQAISLLTGEREALLADLAAMQSLALDQEQELEDARARIGLLSEDLDRAREDVSVGKDTLSLKLAELASLQRDLEALRQVRSHLEGEVGRMLLVLEEAEARRTAIENRLVRTEASLGQSRASEEELAAALVQNRSELERLALHLQERDADLAAERARIDELIAGLGAARDRTMELEARLSDEEERTLLAQREIDERNIRIADLDRLLEVTLSERDSAVELTVLQKEQIESLNSRMTVLLDDLGTLRNRTERDQAEIDDLTRLLGETRDERQSALVRSTSQADEIALLNTQIGALRGQLSTLNDALDAAEAQAVRDQVQIAQLGERLNAALAAKVQELSQFRSYFLEKLHDHLGGRQDIKVVGDRFIIQSGVLFESGSADISRQGREDLQGIAELILELIGEIPEDVPWVLRVDGHTDSVPISTPLFPSNWELSTARSTSVVRYLVDLGVAEHRLMAAGFGEFQPVEPGDSVDALQLNRRIEFKFTDK